MRSLMKSFAAAGLALGLPLLTAPTRAATLPLPYTYSFPPGTNGYIEQMTITDPFSFPLSNLTINESLLSNPTLALSTTTFLDGITPLALNPGQTIQSDTGSGLNLPNTFALPFGPQPQNVLIDPNTQNPLPFVITATATNLTNGQNYGFSIIQTYNANGVPNSTVPESGTMALLAAGLGLLCVAGLRRRHVR
ncbi:MAG: PEP-CTERM sorting domain-containing protein [Armatimonadetes bacterium]|nr:PEP-CTERM sorting domain-containing protein [Armatimonadota bacterium]